MASEEVDPMKFLVTATQIVPLPPGGHEDGNGGYHRE